MRFLALGLVLMVLIGACNVGDSSDSAGGGGDSARPESVGSLPVPQTAEVVDEPAATAKQMATPTPLAQGNPAPAPTREPSVGPDPALVEPLAGDVGSEPTVLPATGLEAAFLAGYRFAGGDPAWESHLIDVVQCESGWDPNAGGLHYGLTQFDAGTWETAKCSPDSDWRDAWEQGCAVARWMSMIAPYYGSTAGWPHCWNVWN